MIGKLTVSEVARQLSTELGVEIRPREISDLFYQRALPESLGPMIGGRRVIDREHLTVIRDALLASQKSRGKGDHDGD